MLGDMNMRQRLVAGIGTAMIAVGLPGASLTFGNIGNATAQEQQSSSSDTTRQMMDACNSMMGMNGMDNNMMDQMNGDDGTPEPQEGQ